MGDVVSVENESGVRITHRVHEIVSTDGATSTLILKGDANTDADISPYMVAEVDRVFFSVPGLGYAVSWLSSPAAIFLGGALVGGVMVLAFGQARSARTTMIPILMAATTRRAHPNPRMTDRRPVRSPRPIHLPNHSEHKDFRCGESFPRES
ncbi:hypothetical protein GS933_25280 [Rhodococcus hoagii]|nr:hypothetical protein [Prescottella equi]